MSFFFDGFPQIGGRIGKAPSPAYVSDFLASSDGLKLIKVFTQIGDAKVRRSLVRLVEEIGGEATARSWYAKFASRILEGRRVFAGLVGHGGGVCLKLLRQQGWVVSLR